MIDQGLLSSLEERADQIPSMNAQRAHHLLRELAREASPDGAIVEMGTWLGAGTAQLALGVGERTDPLTIHSFDRFHASAGETKRAANQGLTLREGTDTKPVVQDLLQGFPADIRLQKVDLFALRWPDVPISLYVDDAAKSPSAFFRIIETFAPFWIPGKTLIVLQDFNYWKKLSASRGRERYKVQRNFVDRHPDCFTEIEYDFLEGSSTAVFRYERAVPLHLIRLGNRVRKAGRFIARKS